MCFWRAVLESSRFEVVFQIVFFVALDGDGFLVKDVHGFCFALGT